VRFGVWGLGFWGLRFGVRGLGFGVEFFLGQGVGFMVQGLVFSPAAAGGKVARILLKTEDAPV